MENELNKSHFKRNLFIVTVLVVSIIIGYIEINTTDDDESTIADRNKWLVLNDLFDKDALDKLKEIVEISKFETKTNDPNVVESAGEAVPAGHPDCDHPYMTLNSNRTYCHLSNRIDVGNHFIASGGFDGYAESYDKLLTRMLSFHKKYLNVDNIKVFENDEIHEKLKNVCANNSVNLKNNKNDIIVDLYQFDLVLLLAGQEIPMHLDVPYFFGADRTTIPQWLLVVMKQSGLFDDLFIPDIKGVLWLTQHDLDNGGNVYLYPYKQHKNKPALLKTGFNQAVLFDGTQVIHGSNRFKRDQIPKFFNHKNYYYYINFNRDTQNWDIYDVNNKLIETYSNDDLQISAVWRMHCFKNLNEKQKFYTQLKENVLSIDKIAEVFKNHLREYKKLPSETIKYLDLWTIILKEYIIYPQMARKYNVLFFNYCLLPRMMPEFINRNILLPILKHFC